MQLGSQGFVATSALSVVIPTYDRDHALVDTVQALLDLPLPPNEIVLADQTARHEPETNSQLTTWHQAGAIKWLRLAQPSIPHAMNQGLLAAEGPLVLFLDDDILPDASLVEAHLKAHRERAGDIVAGRVLQPWHLGRPDSPDKPFGFNAQEPCEVEEFMGGNFSIIRDAALEIGGFDENFVRVAYRFEAEFAYRWRQSGRRIRYGPAALIHHLKMTAGGTRAFGEHLTTLRPDHSVGAYYYLFRTKPLRTAIAAASSRLIQSVKTKHHLRQPWWVPITFIAELRGLSWAVLLALRTPKYVDPLTGAFEKTF